MVCVCVKRKKSAEPHEQGSKFCVCVCVCVCLCVCVKITEPHEQGSKCLCVCVKLFGEEVLQQSYLHFSVGPRQHCGTWNMLLAYFPVQLFKMFYRSGDSAGCEITGPSCCYRNFRCLGCGIHPCSSLPSFLSCLVIFILLFFLVLVCFLLFVCFSFVIVGGVG